MTKKIVVFIGSFLIAAGSVGAVQLLAEDSPAELQVYTPSNDSQPAPTELPGPNDCCAEWTATNFPIPAKSARGDHCPANAVPEGSDVLFAPEDGRIEISFYDVGYEESRTFILDIRDPACFEQHATRRAIFFEVANYMSYSDGNLTAACRRLREAIRAGSLKLGEEPFDLRPAQPHVDEVCVP